MSTPTETLGPAARRRRNRQIASARAEGQTWPVIARRFKLSERQARRAAAEAHEIEAELVDGADTEGVLKLVAEVQLRALNQLDELMTGGADNSNAVVGACRAAGTVGSALLDTWSRAGALPDPQTLRLGAEVAHVVDALVRVADDLGIDKRKVQRHLADEPALVALGAAA